MSVICAECQATQPAPAAGSQSLCLSCGASLGSQAAAPAAAPIRMKAAPAPASTRAAASSDDDFSARTMSMVRPELNAGDALPSLAALVAEAHKEATQTGRQPPAAASAAPPPFVAPAKPMVLWHVRQPDGSELGPTSQEELLAWQQQKRVGEQTMVWRAGFDKWLPLPEGLAFAGIGRQSVAAQPLLHERTTQDAESFLSEAAAPSDHLSGTKTVVQRAPSSRRPKWHRAAAAAAGASLLAGLVAIGVSKLGKSRDAVAEVQSAAPAAAEPDGPPAPPADEPAQAAPAAVKRPAHPRGHGPAGHRAAKAARRAERDAPADGAEPEAADPQPQ